MAKNYLWFKFYPSEWLMGRIQRQTEITQAAFLRLCCKYWHNECLLSYEEAEMECGEEEYKSLLKYRIITLENNHVKIKFLDEQKVENDEFRELQSIRGKRSAAAKKANKETSTSVQPDSTSVQPAFNGGSVLVQPNSTIKNKNENKIKRDVFIPPSLNEVKAYFLEKGYSQVAAEKAFDYYQSANWSDSKGSKVISWKQKMISVWFKDEYKIKSTGHSLNIPMN